MRCEKPTNMHSGFVLRRNDVNFKCPYTEICRADALHQFAELPELALLFSQRLQCAERNEANAYRCAARLQLIDKELPTLGRYVQEQRRAKQVPQAAFAAQVGMDIQTLRDLELNKLNPTRLPRRILEGIATILSAPADYLVALAKLTSQAGSPRQGTIFARAVLPTNDEPSEPQL